MRKKYLIKKIQWKLLKIKWKMKIILWYRLRKNNKIIMNLII